MHAHTCTHALRHMYTQAGTYKMHTHVHTGRNTHAHTHIHACSLISVAF